MSECRHRWASIPGSNDYECEWCGSRKGDTGSIYPSASLTTGHVIVSEWEAQDSFKYVCAKCGQRWPCRFRRAQPHPSTDPDG